MIPKPELRGFWWDSHTKPTFGETSAEVAIVQPELLFFATRNLLVGAKHMTLCDLHETFWNIGTSAFNLLQASQT